MQQGTVVSITNSLNSLDTSFEFPPLSTPSKNRLKKSGAKMKVAFHVAPSKPVPMPMNSFSASTPDSKGWVEFNLSDVERLSCVVHIVYIPTL